MDLAAALMIVALGDSTTAGTPFFKSPVEVAPNGAGDATAPFPAHIEATHPGWTVLNRGVNGERTDQIAARFDRDVIASHPQVVVIIGGVNDVYQGRSVESVTEQLHAMYAQARAAKIPVIAGSIVPFNTASPEQNQRMHQINEWIKAEASRDDNISFVDTRAAAAIPGNIDRLASSPDGLHPSVAGYHRMGDVIAVAIQTLLNRQHGGAT